MKYEKGRLNLLLRKITREIREGKRLFEWGRKGVRDLEKNNNTGLLEGLGKGKKDGNPVRRGDSNHQWGEPA